MPRTILAKLSEKADCESFRDFGQYYRHRYFARRDGGVLTPCWAVDGTFRDNGCNIAHMDQPIESGGHEPVTWERLKRNYAFGSPILGTCVIGPTYCYLAARPVRESAKGLSANRITWDWVHGDFLQRAYGRANPAFFQGIGGEHLGSKEEMRSIYNIYNKTYYGIPEALEELESGSRIGCPISPELGFYFSPDIPDILASYKNWFGIGRVIPHKIGGNALELKPRHKWLKAAIQYSLQNEILVL